MTRQNIVACLVLLFSMLPVPSLAGEISIYPPTNSAAGSGLLYFPEGGSSSLYAVPVISDDLTAAINAQTEEIKNLATLFQRSSGAIQCFSDGGGLSGSYFCINSATGRVCHKSQGSSWSCSTPMGYDP